MDEPSAPFSPLEMGRRIRRRRLDWGLQQNEVAARIPMNKSTYSALERGEKILIRPAQLARLADVLVTTTDYLLQRSEERGEIPNLPCQGVQCLGGTALDSPSSTEAEAS